MHGIETRIVYILRSDGDPLRHYVGITNNVRDRLEWHNHGPSGHTTSHRPWALVDEPSQSSWLTIIASGIIKSWTTRASMTGTGRPGDAFAVGLGSVGSSIAMNGPRDGCVEFWDITEATNYNGGVLAFGADGKLYAGLRRERQGRECAVAGGNLLGKMLRVNADGTIPTDNPCFASAAGSNRPI